MDGTTTHSEPFHCSVTSGPTRYVHVLPDVQPVIRAQR
jgi:hypothetical protein